MRMEAKEIGYEANIAKRIWYEVNKKEIKLKDAKQMFKGLETGAVSMAAVDTDMA